MPGFTFEFVCDVRKQAKNIRKCKEMGLKIALKSQKF